MERLRAIGTVVPIGPDAFHTAARNLAAALEAAGRPGDALPHRQSATQISETLDPPEPELHGRDLLSLARVQQQLGRFDDAQRTLRGRLAMTPGDAATATACFNLATALLRQGRTGSMSCLLYTSPSPRDS